MFHISEKNTWQILHPSSLVLLGKTVPSHLISLAMLLGITVPSASLFPSFWFSTGFWYASELMTKDRLHSSVFIRWVVLPWRGHWEVQRAYTQGMNGLGSTSASLLTPCGDRAGLQPVVIFVPLPVHMGMPHRAFLKGLCFRTIAKLPAASSPCSGSCLT